MSGSIFHLDQNGKAIELYETTYESENLFQQLIEEYPGILAGDQISPDQPRKWIFISREMGVPKQEGGSDQWFLDHLFIDQDAVPTFVEVKRSTDTRIRREVVAQMLDYAANATAYWPVQRLRAAYEDRCQSLNRQPLIEIGIDPAEEDFYWEKVGTNLRLGKLRLLFVADEIPVSLQRIIEYLNGQMTDTEVLGLEIKQYVSKQNVRTLVPRIIGQTATAAQVKSRAKNTWTEETFLARIRQNDSEGAADICSKLLDSFRRLGCTIWWGQGGKQAGFVPIYEGKQRHQLAAIYSYEKCTSVEICFQHFKGPFASIEKQRELKQRFCQIPNIQIPDSRLRKRPSFDCMLLKKSESLQLYMKIYEDMLQEIKKLEQ